MLLCQILYAHPFAVVTPLESKGQPQVATSATADFDLPALAMAKYNSSHSP